MTKSTNSHAVKAYLHRETHDGTLPVMNSPPQKWSYQILSFKLVRLAVFPFKFARFNKLLHIFAIFLVIYEEMRDLLPETFAQYCI